MKHLKQKQRAILILCRSVPLVLMLMGSVQAAGVVVPGVSGAKMMKSPAQEKLLRSVGKKAGIVSPNCIRAGKRTRPGSKTGIISPNCIRSGQSQQSTGRAALPNERRAPAHGGFAPLR